MIMSGEHYYRCIQILTQQFYCWEFILQIWCTCKKCCKYKTIHCHTVLACHKAPCTKSKANDTMKNIEKS